MHAWQGASLAAWVIGWLGEREGREWEGGWVFEWVMGGWATRYRKSRNVAELEATAKDEEKTRKRIAFHPRALNLRKDISQNL